jgi:V/A-type H+-transporting ATPase subunit E
MEESGSTVDAAADGAASSSGVEALIERLRQRGVEAGRTAKTEIVAEAEREAEKIVKQAREKASELIEDARHEADRLRASGEDALRVAVRDTVLRMRETLRKRLEGQVRKLVSEQLVDREFLKQLILEVARRARDESGAAAAESIEVLLPAEAISLDELQRQPEELESRLSHFAKEIASETWREGVSIGTLDAGERGIRIRLKEEELEIDLSDRAIADLLLAHLQPRFRAVMEGQVW